MLSLPVLSLAPVSSASGIPQIPQVQVYTSLNDTNQYLFVPLNSSGLNTYPEWYISIFSSQKYSLFIDGNLTESGYGPININQDFYHQSNVSVQLTIGKTVYTFTDEKIIGSQPSVNIQSVSAVSSYRGQNQQLTALPGQSGQLMYSNWTITLKSGSNESYAIYVGKNEVDRGYVLGSENIELNISKGPATVTVGLGSKTYTFSNELIASVPLKQYYSPPKPPLVATALDIVYAVGIGVIDFAIWMVVAGTTFRPWIMDKLKRKPRSR
jgi:hypothetical protein